MVVVSTCVFGSKRIYYDGLKDTVSKLKLFPQVVKIIVHTDRPELMPDGVQCEPLLYSPSHHERNALSRFVALAQYDCVLVLDANAFQKRTVNMAVFTTMLEEMERACATGIPFVWTPHNWWKHDRLDPYMFDAGMLGVVNCRMPKIVFEDMCLYGSAPNRISSIMGWKEARFRTGYALDEKWLEEKWFPSLPVDTHIVRCLMTKIGRSKWGCNRLTCTRASFVTRGCMEKTRVPSLTTTREWC